MKFLQRQQYIFYYIALVIVLVGVSLFQIAPAMAVGVSPGIIELSDIGNNIKLERTIQVSRGETTGEAHFEVTTDGAGARYLELPTTSFMMKDGERTANWSFFIHPQNAPNEAFEATITFLQGGNSGAKSDSVGKITAAMSVREGALVKLRFSVTNKEIKQYAVLKAQTEHSEVGQKPFINFIFKNQGNVDARPDKIVVRVINQTDPTDIITMELPSAVIEVVAPGQEQSINVALPQEVPQGKYFMDADFFQNDKIIFTQEKMLLLVYPAGTLAQKIAIENFTTNATTIGPGELIKIDAKVKNIGNIITKTTWYTEIKKDDKVIDLLRSEEKLIPVGQEGKFTLTFRPADKGEYTLDGYATYGPGESEHKNIKVLVTGSGWLSNWGSNIFYVLGGAAVLFVLGWLIRKIWRARAEQPHPATMRHESSSVASKKSPKKIKRKRKGVTI